MPYVKLENLSLPYGTFQQNKVKAPKSSLTMDETYQCLNLHDSKTVGGFSFLKPWSAVMEGLKPGELLGHAAPVHEGHFKNNYYTLTEDLVLEADTNELRLIKTNPENGFVLIEVEGVLEPRVEIEGRVVKFPRTYRVPVNVSAHQNIHTNRLLSGTVSLSGPNVVGKEDFTVMTIKPFDAFSTYIFESEFFEGYIEEDKLYIRALESTVTAKSHFTVYRNGLMNVFWAEIGNQSIEKPTITYPEENGNIPLSSSVEITPLVTSNEHKTHSRTEWLFSVDPYGSNVVHHAITDVDLETYFLDPLTFTVDRVYYVKVRVEEATMGWSEWSDIRLFRTVPTSLPKDIVGTIVIDDPGPYEMVGDDIAMHRNGKFIAVGNALRDDRDLTDSGTVHVYQRTGLSWTEMQVIRPSELKLFERFGSAVCMSPDGRHLFATAPYYEYRQWRQMGRVLHYQMIDGLYVEQSQLPTPAFIEFQHHGKSVDSDARGLKLAVAYSRGWDYFEKVDGEWHHRHREQISYPTEALGRSIKMSKDGRWVLVTDHLREAATGTEGAVYVYEYREGTYHFVQVLTEPDVVGFGYSIDIDEFGSSLIVGTRSDTVFIYSLLAGKYQFRESLTYSALTDNADYQYDSNTGFGMSVSINGTGEVLSVAAPMVDRRPMLDVGEVFMYRRQVFYSERDTQGATKASEFTHVTSLKAPEERPDGRFGSSVNLTKDSSTAFIGSPGIDDIYFDVGGFFIFK